MNFFSNNSNSKLYHKYIFEIEKEEKNFNVMLNEQKENIIGFVCKFTNSNGIPIKLFRSDSYLSICRIITGDILTYELEEKISCDMQHYTDHQQFMNNLAPNKFMWIYFFQPFIVNQPIKLYFEIEYNEPDQIFLHINTIYFQEDKPNLPVNRTINDCMKEDYDNDLLDTDIGSMLWMCRENQLVNDITNKFDESFEFKNSNIK